MKNLTPIAVLFLATKLTAQGVDAQAPAIEPNIDPVAAEVFADDVIAPQPEVTQPEVTQAEVTQEVQPATEQESEPDWAPAAPPGEQIVPVAADDEAADEMTVQLPPDATDEEQLMIAYERYKQLMRDGVFDEADSVAKRVVELAIKVTGPQSTDFSKALTNLAIVQHRNAQYDAAQQNFQSAIEIIESNEDRLNEQLINPLKGLGASQLEGGRPDLAGATFRRAVHVTHVNDGPHNLQQIEILDSLAESNLRLGSTEDAMRIQDMIYALNERAFSENSLELVPSLMRRAEWQHRAGFISDERATLRRAVRIIEVKVGKNDLRLLAPLTRLGQSFYFVDASGSASTSQSLITTGEIYFKKAARIAEENPEASWEMIAQSKLALGDYYMVQHSTQQAARIYKKTWASLADEEDRLAYRKKHLEQFVALIERPIPQHVNTPSDEPPTDQDPPLLNGNITVAYNVSAKGRATGLKIIESQPAGFATMERNVQRELRRRIYRPRFVDAQPAVSENQLLIHRFFYQQADLDALQEKTTAAEPEADQT